MKKYIIALSFFILFGCTENNVLEAISVPSRTIPNQKCEDVPAVQVFQVLDKFALALTCEYGKYTNNLNCWGHTVYLTKDKGKIYYDEQIIKPENGKCIVYTGIYKYESKDGNLRTVPRIKFVNDEVENPDYKQYIKEKELEKNIHSSK